MKTRNALVHAAMFVQAISLVGCMAASDDEFDGAEEVAEAEDAVTGAEVLDTQQTNFNGSGLPWGTAPVGQVFTPNNTGYLTKFSFAAGVCQSNCGFTFELRNVDTNGNPGTILWTARGTQPMQADPGWAFGWSTTTFVNPPIIRAGTQYALTIRPDAYQQYIWGNGNAGYVALWQPQGGYWVRVGNGDDLLFKAWVAPITAPSTCIEAKGTTGATTDGEYMLSVAGRTIPVYCRNMASATPTEYITVRTGGGANVSYYGAGQNSSGLTTSFTKVRFFPDTVTIDWEDVSFSSSTGWKQFGSNVYYNNVYAEAADCRSGFSQTGTANVDLRGTFFTVAPNQFSTTGYAPAGSVAYSGFNQVVNLTGGGFCGGTTPSGPLLSLGWLDNVPTSCAGVRAQNSSAGDGEYTLSVGGKPALIYCRDMAGTPKEYLTLKNTGASANFSQYTAGGYRPGTTVKTLYNKVRIDLSTLMVHIGDQTFATTSGSIQHGGTLVTSMPYGIGMSCNSGPTGLANIDLTGTPFAVAQNEFITDGYAASGSATYSSGGKVVNVTGGGECGWTMPTWDIYDPVNQTGGFQLNLVYAP